MSVKVGRLNAKDLRKEVKFGDMCSEMGIKLRKW